MAVAELRAARRELKYVELQVDAVGGNFSETSVRQVYELSIEVTETATRILKKIERIKEDGS